MNEQDQDRRTRSSTVVVTGTAPPWAGYRVLRGAARWRNSLNSRLDGEGAVGGHRREWKVGRSSGALATGRGVAAVVHGGGGRGARGRRDASVPDFEGTGLTGRITHQIFHQGCMLHTKDGPVPHSEHFHVCRGTIPFTHRPYTLESPEQDVNR